MIEGQKILHGRDKEPEPGDPMELVMVEVEGGDPEFMATCIIEEYARLGMDEDEIFRLFSQPAYQTHAFYQNYGETWVRNLIRKVLSRTGRMRISVKYESEILPKAPPRALRISDFPQKEGCDA